MKRPKTEKNVGEKKQKKEAWTVGPIYRCDFGKI